MTDTATNPGRFLTEAEAIDMALSAAVVWTAEPEAYATFLCLDDAFPRFGLDGDAFSAWAIGFAGTVCLQLIARADELATWIGASRDQRARFIAACAGCFRATLNELVGAHGLRGSA